MNKNLIWFVLATVAVQGIVIKGEASDKIKTKADIRYRHERISEESTDYTRNRQRIRARLELTMTVAENVAGVIRLASGSDSPVSTNQTLTDGFSTKSIMLDLAYIDWHPVSLKGFFFRAGKIKVPFYKAGKNELLWDGDLNPEGVSANYSPDMGSFNFFIHTGYFWVEERKTTDDAMLIGFQGGLKTKLSSTLSFLAGSGYYNYTSTKGHATFFNPTKSFGNSVDKGGNYRYDFNELEFFGELKIKIWKFPLSVFGDYVKNTAVQSSNTGWLAGFNCKIKSFSFKYDYRRLEKDAVLGAFTFSDFIGGGTNGKGHTFGFSFPVGKNIKAGVVYLLNKKGLENGENYNRLQVDLNIKI